MKEKRKCKVLCKAEEDRVWNTLSESCMVQMQTDGKTNLSYKLHSHPQPLTKLHVQDFKYFSGAGTAK